MSLSGITIRRFRPDDLDGMGAIDSMPVAILDSRNYSISFLRHGTAIACAGLIVMWAGVAEAWTVLGAEAKAHPLWIVRALREQIRQQAESMNLHRVQMHVKESDPFLLKWGHVLGFQQEGTLRKYTKDRQTMHILSWMPDAHT